MDFVFRIAEIGKSPADLHTARNGKTGNAGKNQFMEVSEIDRVRFSRKLFSLWLREEEVIDRLRIRDRLAAKMWSFYKRHRRITDRKWRKAADLIECGKIEWILSGDCPAPEKTPKSKSMASLAEDLKRVFAMIQEKNTAKTPLEGSFAENLDSGGRV